MSIWFWVLVWFFWLFFGFFLFVFYTTGNASAMLGCTAEEKLATKLPVTSVGSWATSFQPCCEPFIIALLGWVAGLSVHCVTGLGNKVLLLLVGRLQICRY